KKDRAKALSGAESLDTATTQLGKPSRTKNLITEFVAFALAAGRHLRLPAAARPRVTQGAPLRKTGFILKQDHTASTRGRTDNRRPFFLKPGQARRGVEMIRHKASLLKRQAQVVQQRTHILAVVEHAELAPDQHPDEDRVPTGCLTAHHEWPCLNQLHQTLLLLGGQLRSAPTALVVD